MIELGLKNVTVASGRVEAMHDKKVDVVTSRAFAELHDFIALTKHLLNEKWLLGSHERRVSLRRIGKCATKY